MTVYPGNHVSNTALSSMSPCCFFSLLFANVPQPHYVSCSANVKQGVKVITPRHVHYAALPETDTAILRHPLLRHITRLTTN